MSVIEVIGFEGTSEITLGERGAERLLGRGHLLAKLEAHKTFVSPSALCRPCLHRSCCGGHAYECAVMRTFLQLPPLVRPSAWTAQLLDSGYLRLLDHPTSPNFLGHNNSRANHGSDSCWRDT